MKCIKTGSMRLAVATVLASAVTCGSNGVALAHSFWNLGLEEAYIAPASPPPLLVLSSQALPYWESNNWVSGYVAYDDAVARFRLHVDSRPE